MLNNKQMALLQSLRKAKQHGYQIMKFAEKLGFTIGAASLYNQLSILTDMGYITHVPSPANETDSRKMYFELTDKGVEAIQ